MDGGIGWVDGGPNGRVQHADIETTRGQADIELARIHASHGAHGQPEKCPNLYLGQPSTAQNRPFSLKKMSVFCVEGVHPS